MSELIKDDDIGQDRRDQMLKLVSKGFYKELVNYGVKREEIIRVASHLLDNLMTERAPRGAGTEFYDNLFSIGDVKDEWHSKKQIAVRDIALRPLKPDLVDQIASWLDSPGARDLFVPPYPESEAALRKHLLETPSNSYLAIHVDGKAVGIVGGEHIDSSAGKLEMKKLIGDPKTRGKGIGKRATFGFCITPSKSSMHTRCTRTPGISTSATSISTAISFRP